jgi:hypothetical protein
VVLGDGQGRRSIAVVETHSEKSAAFVLHPAALPFMALAKQPVRWATGFSNGG